VIEDSLVGLRAAKDANMKCVITYCESTDKVDFYTEGADAKLPNLGKVGLKELLGPLRSNPHAELLEGFRDTGKKVSAHIPAAAPKAAFDAAEQKAIGDLKKRTNALHQRIESASNQKVSPAPAPARVLSWYPHAMILKP
jgi:hypothetical protein